MVETPGTSGDTVTIAGRVFYNDRREYGLHSTRRDPDGRVGTPCGIDGVRADGGDCAVNHVGAYGMGVDVIERDGSVSVWTEDCRTEERLTSATVSGDGTFVAVFVPTEACGGDTWSEPAITLRVRLRHCGEDACFSVNERLDDAYALYHPDANDTAPLLVEAGTTYQLSDMSFRAAGTDAAEATDIAVAANYHASLVDTVVSIHEEAGVPFLAEAFGEVQYVYPSDDTQSATTLSAGEVVLVQREDWVEGGVVAHEYGHVLMLRAWGGDYGWDGVGLPWSVSEALEPRLAFKEGWGNYVARAVFIETHGCASADFDDNTATPTTGPSGEGSAWVTDVNKVLCDWYDTRDDDDPAMAGTGDRFEADDFLSVWSNLRGMYVSHDAYGGDPAAGLTLCDWVDYYLDVRQSSETVGGAGHDAYVAQIADLLYQNNVTCGLSSPSG